MTSRKGAWTIVARRGEMERALAFVARHDDSLAAVAGGGSRGRLAGASGRGRLFEAEDGAGRTIVVKALRRGGLPGKLAGGTYGSRRLLAEMEILEEAAEREVPTARLAFGATSAPKGGRTVAMIATVKLAGAASLAEWVERIGRGGPQRRSRNDILARAGAVVRRAHDRGLDHSDLNIGNILVRPVERPPGMRVARAVVEAPGPEALGAWVIDLGLSHLGPPLSPGPRASNIVRLLRSAEKHLGSDSVRLRDAAAFLHGYLASGGGAKRALRSVLLAAIRRRLPAIALHRLGWALRGQSR